MDLGMARAVGVEDEPFEVGREIGMPVCVLRGAHGCVRFAYDRGFAGLDIACDEFAGALPVVAEEVLTTRGSADVIEAIARRANALWGFVCRYFDEVAFVGCVLAFGADG